MPIGETELKIVARMRDEASQKMGKIRENTEGNAKKMRKAIDDMQPAFRNMAKYGTAAFSAITGGSLKAATDVGNYADEILDASEATGIGTDALQEWQHVTRDAGVSADVMDSSVDSLSRRMRQAQEEGTEQNKIMRELEVELEKVGGGLRDTDDVMTDLIVAFGEMEPGLERNQMAMELFGRRADELAPIMGMTAEEIEKVREEAHELGFVLGDEALEQANEFRKEWGILQESFAVAYRQIGLAVIPILQDLIESIGPIIRSVAEWIEENQELTATIIKWGAILSGTIAVLGTLGMVIPKVKAGFLLLKGAILGVKKALVILTAHPIIAVLTAIAAAVVILVQRFRSLTKEVGSTERAWGVIIHRMRRIFWEFVEAVGEGVNMIAQYIPGIAEITEEGLERVRSKVKENEESFNELKHEIAEYQRQNKEATEDTNDFEKAIEEATQGFEEMEDRSVASMENTKDEMGELKREIESINDEMARAHEQYLDRKESEEERYHDRMARKVAEYEMSVKDLREEALKEEEAGNDKRARDLFETINEKQRELNKFYGWDLDLYEEIDREKEKMEMGELERMRADHEDKMDMLTEEHDKEMEELEERKQTKLAKIEEENKAMQEQKEKHEKNQGEMSDEARKSLNDRIRMVSQFAQSVGKTAAGRFLGVSSVSIPEIAQIPERQHGGRVPGPKGTPVPIMAHGQEEIMSSTGARTTQGGTVVNNIKFEGVTVRSEDDIRKLRQQFEKAMRSVSINTKFHTI